MDITYFAETENSKHCSKIIFKCVNSTVELIFNEKVDKKWSLWVREKCTSALFTVEKSTKPARRKKKKKNLTTRKVESVNVDVLSKLHLKIIHQVFMFFKKNM